MFASFSTALSALTADETAINVVGNNLANLNTPGFKNSVVSFSDLVTQSLGGAGQTQVGGGVGRPVTLTQFSQGAIQSTAGPLDAAIQGDGFFIVQGPNNATEYTRGGNFQVNSSGTLETSTGEPLQGWTAAGGVLSTIGPTGNITVPTGTLTAPIATTRLYRQSESERHGDGGKRSLLDIDYSVRLAWRIAHRDLQLHADRDAESVELFGQHSRGPTPPP